MGPMDDAAMRQCITNCTTCHQTCLAMVHHCLTKGGAHAAAAHVRLMLDCAEICRTSADFMIRMSPLHGQTCRACSVVCGQCADDCARLNDDPMMAQCVEVCRRCADSCGRMAA